MKPESPETLYGPLFEALHKARVHPDGKRITDALPKKSPAEILKAYLRERDSEGFDLKQFFNSNFTISEELDSGFRSDSDRPVKEHIEVLWDVLSRENLSPEEGSNALGLPYPYIVPGGRFNEIYYWDSYFTMLGLKASGRKRMIRHMVSNFAYMIRTFGFIPNGNRSYFLSRSQPPFFSLMVELLSGIEGDRVFLEFADELEIEYQFWMTGSGQLTPDNNRHDRVCLIDGSYLNLYFDNSPRPRAEMYGEDLELAESSKREKPDLFRNLRAACESGWDFSSRWLENPERLETIACADIVPVDLNCLLWHLEHILSRANALRNNNEKAGYYSDQADKRAARIATFFWNEDWTFFTDFHLRSDRLRPIRTLAGAYPLYFGLASRKQADQVAFILETEFLKPGGLVTTTCHSGQQWDAPNGWAPLQWMVIQGLRRYGQDRLANEVKDRWTNLNTKVYRNTGKLLEKYNVENTSLLSGGGEYPVQDGFGWTNGVLLALLNEDET